MCSVSMIIDDFSKRWAPMQGQQPLTPMFPPGQYIPLPGGPTREEFDALKREVEALRGLLEAAKKFDDETGQADCEQAEKVALLKQIAKLVGIDLSDIIEGTA